MIRRAKKGKLQSVWNYMRRNRAFCVEELMLSTGIDKSYLKSFLWHLENAGYIKSEKSNIAFEKKCFRLLRDTGAIVPKANRGEIYDYNLNKSYLIEGKIKRALYDVLKGIEAEELLLEVCDSFELMEYKRIIKDSKKVDRVDMIDDIAKRIGGSDE